MNKKDLDALNELYLSVYDGEQLNEDSNPYARIPDSQLTSNELLKKRDPNYGKQSPQQVKQAQSAKAERATQQRADLGVVRSGPDGKGKFVSKLANSSSAPSPWGSDQVDPQKKQQSIDLANNLNKSFGFNRKTNQPGQKPPITPVSQQRQGTGGGSGGGGGGTPPRPTASGPVLAKKGGVEGKLDKATGKFTAGAFSGAEKSRYASVAAQNAARTSASSGTSKPAASTSTPSASPKPAIGKLGNTSFERRIPTSAELRAAQGERERQKNAGEKPNAEKALQAAQKTNLPTQGPTPAIPDLKSVNTDLAKANSPAVINRPAPAGTALAAQQAQQKKPPTPGTGAIMQKQSYEWPSAKTIRDIAGAYASIYEAKKKVDQDEDGDNDFADVRIARMIASGMSREQAIAMTKNKSYNKEEIEYVDELYQGRHGQSETEYQDSRSNAGKMVSGTSKLSGAAYSSRGVENTGPNPAGGSKRPRGQGRMTRGQRIEMEYRKANLNREEVELIDEKYMGFKKLKAAIAAKGGVRDPGAVAASIGRKKYGKKKFQKAAATDHKLGEAYEAYEFVASYLLENNFAETLNDANVIINNMSESWFNQIMEG